MPTVQKHSFKKEAGCQSGRQLLWIKVTILQWFHLLVALVTHVRQSNTTTRRDNLIVLDLRSVGLLRGEYEFIGCMSSNETNQHQVCKKSTAVNPQHVPLVYMQSVYTVCHIHWCHVNLLHCGFSLNVKNDQIIKGQFQVRWKNIAIAGELSSWCFKGVFHQFYTWKSDCFSSGGVLLIQSHLNLGLEMRHF